MFKVDTSVKLPSHCSGRFKGSFAYLTIKDRLPVILVKVLDTLCQDKNSIGEVHGEEGKEDSKRVIGRLSALQNEMITNKPIKPLTSDGADVSIWNAYLEQQNATHDFAAAWYESSWLYVECYLYRRIREAFELSSVLQDHDPFFKQKLESLLSSIEDVEKLGRSLRQTIADLHVANDDLYTLFVSFLEISLWGNKCDLSISAGAQNRHFSYEVKDLRSKILVNDTEKVWNLLREVNDRKSGEVHLSLVLDNAGFELFGDLCLLHFLLAAKLASKVSIHVKQIPWFVSDTMERDVECLLETLSRNNREDLPELSRQWRQYLATGTWRLESEPFWTLPHDYAQMSSADPKLYAKLGESDLVILKGDLNYRKLTGDRMWEETVPFRTALGGFLPTSLVALRTIKADVVVGLPAGTTQTLNNASTNWKYTGEYGLIQCEIKEGKE